MPSDELQAGTRPGDSRHALLQRLRKFRQPLLQICWLLAVDMLTEHLQRHNCIAVDKADRQEARQLLGQRDGLTLRQIETVTANI